MNFRRFRERTVASQSNKQGQIISGHPVESVDRSYFIQAQACGCIGIRSRIRDTSTYMCGPVYGALGVAAHKQLACSKIYYDKH